MISEAFHFAGSGGQHLAGRLDLPDGTPRAYAVFAHCFTCTRKSRAAAHIARALTLRGIGVLCFDFTGLGDSGGDLSDHGFSGNIDDLVAASAEMRRHQREPSLMIGHSLGGAAVLAAAARLPNIQAVATIAAPFDVQHVTRLFAGQLDDIVQRGEAEINLGGKPFTIRRSFLDDLGSHNPLHTIAHLKRPLLVLHSPLDAIVNIDNASSIFLAARHPKSFISLDDADHLLTKAEDGEYAAEVIAAWASRYLNATPDPAPAIQDAGVVVAETGVGKYQVEITAAGAHFFADEPVDVGGLGSGPSPYQLLSASLGACTAMTLRLYANQKQWPLTRISVFVNHAKRTAEPHDVFTRGITLEGHLEPAQQDRLIEIANKCPVHRTLEQGSLVETRKKTHEEIRKESRKKTGNAAPQVSAALAEPEAQHFIDMEQACGESS
jgi:uncharacterized OsmC-like protein/alpha-beta hydrolase superfamily lysophospholipase